MDPSTFARLNNLENRTTILGISLQNTERKAKEALTLAQNGAGVAAVKKELEEELETKIGTVDSTGAEVSGIGAVISGEEGKKSIVFIDENGDNINVADPISELALPLTTTGTGAGNFGVDTYGKVSANGGLDVAGKFTVNSDGEVTAASVSDGTNSLSGLAASIDALETTVGDSSGGLVKDVNVLKTTVGDSAGGLVKDVAQASFKAEAALTEVQNSVRLNPSAAQTISNDLTLSNGKLTIGSSATDETLLQVNGNINSNKITAGEMNINDKLKMNENGTIVYLPNAENPGKTAITFDVDENNRVNINTHNCSLYMWGEDPDYTTSLSARNFACASYSIGTGTCDRLEAIGYSSGSGIFSEDDEGVMHALHDTVIRNPENTELVQTIDSKVTIGRNISSFENNRLQVNGPATFSFMRGSDEHAVKIGGDYDYDLLADNIRVNKGVDFYGVTLTQGEDEIGNLWIQSDNTIKMPTAEIGQLVSKGSTSLIKGATVGDLDNKSELNITDKLSIGTTVTTGYGDPIYDESTQAVLKSTVRERKTYLAEWPLVAQQAILGDTAQNYVISPSAPNLPDGSPYDPTVSQATFTVSIKYPEGFSKYDKTIIKTFAPNRISELIINYCPIRDGFDYTCWIESAKLSFTLNAGETYEVENVKLTAKAQYRDQSKYVDIKSDGITIGNSETEIPINVNGRFNLKTEVPEEAGSATSAGKILSKRGETLATFDINARDVDYELRNYLRTYGKDAGLQLQSDKDILIEANNGLTIDSATTCTGNVTVGSTASQANVNVNGTLTTISGEKTMTVNGEGIDLTQTSSGEEYKLLRLYMDNGGTARVEAGTYNLGLKAANELDLTAQMINFRSPTQAYADMYIGTEENTKELTVRGSATIGLVTDTPSDVLTVNGNSTLIGTTTIGTPSYNAYLEVNGDIISTSNSFKLGNLYMSYNQYDGIITFSDPKLGKSASITLN